jgi:tRNA (mo5U34)-methyltransferase
MCGEARLGRSTPCSSSSTLCHLRHPLLALDRLAAICDDTSSSESRVCDDYAPIAAGSGMAIPATTW